MKRKTAARAHVVTTALLEMASLLHAQLANWALFLVPNQCQNVWRVPLASTANCRDKLFLRAAVLPGPIAKAVHT